MESLHPIYLEIILSLVKDKQKVRVLHKLPIDIIVKASA